MKKSLLLAGLVSVALVAGQASAGWTDWTSANAQEGTAVGTLVMVANTVTVRYAGEINFAQTSSGTNYWASNNSTYTQAGVVSNGPGDSDIIALIGGPNTTVNTITFSQAVVNPIMAIMSHGQPNVPVRYVFDQPFDVLNYGQGHWGNGTLTELAGNILEGREGHGLIQFQGTFDSISWICPTAENWHGFTVGAPDTIAAVPAPGALLLSGLGTGLVGWLRKRKS